MLIKNHLSLEKDANIIFTKTADGKDASALGAFPADTKLIFSLVLPRKLGASAVVIRIRRDGCDSVDVPFEYDSLEGQNDRYSIELDTSCTGLFFYEILLVRGYETLFLSSINNVDFELCDKSENQFHLLVYEKDFDTPDWVKGGTMYHVFVDRFFRGEGNACLHGGIINDDWDNGIPQFAEKVGDPLSNDVFFGGNLWGVAQKLDYLCELGVNVIYLSPVFESASNHRYDTGDYEKIDSLLGGEEAFDTLVREAHARNIKIILDGVFNHTGDDSRYFNKRGSYDDTGAYQSEKSPYADWFNFTEFPDSYEAWWGIEIMPRLQHSNEQCRKYFTGKNGIVQRWLERGADGWRLDVADELDDTFLHELNETAKNTKNAFIIGEVWENAVLKSSYGKRRHYFWGKQLDSVMNYPLKNAIIALLTTSDTEFFYNTVTELYSSYPKPVLDSLMNIISTHDTERILTVLGDSTLGEGLSNQELSTKRLNPTARKKAKRLLKIASVIQYTMFGIPSLYYGDEAGIEGYHDPFCRMPFVWGKEDKELIKHYKMLGGLRKKHSCLADGDFKFVYCKDGVVIYKRKNSRDSLTVAVNTTDIPVSISGLKIDAKSFKII